MRRTIYLPEQMAEQVDQYLRDHPGMSLSTLVQEALRDRIAPRSLKPLLEIAGFVEHASTQADEWAEDQFVSDER